MTTLRKNLSGIDSLAWILLAVVGSLMIGMLLIMAIFNQLIADDVAYFQYFNVGHPWDFLYWHYFGHTGRLLQSLLVASGYTLFGDFSVKIMPTLILLGFSASISWAAYRFMPWKKHPVALSVATGMAMAGAALFIMPSTYDSYLWWTSSSIYLTSIMTLVLNACILDVFIKNSQLSKTKQVLLLLVVALGQTLSEITSVVMIAAAGLLLVYFVIKKHKKWAVAALKVFIALCIGFLATYFSPGSIHRRASEDGGSLGFDVIRIFVLSTKHFWELLATVSLWEVALLAGIGILIGFSLKKLPKKAVRITLGVALLAILVGVYGSFCANNYVWYNMSWRTFTLPSFILTVVAIITIAVVSNRIYHHPKKVGWTLYVACVMLTAYGTVKLAANAITDIDFLITRNSAYYTREMAIRTQLQSNSSDMPIRVSSLPVLMQSQAIDLQYGAREQVAWYENALKSQNNIPANTPIMVEPSPVSYCTYGMDGKLCTQDTDNTSIGKLLNKTRQFLIYYLQ